MPLKTYIPPGRAFYYLRGTVRAGKKARSVYESAGIGKGEPGAATRAEEIRLRRETEIYNELLYGSRRVVTFTENASDYCEKRNRDRVAENPTLAGAPDKEAEYVAKWITFLRRRGLADLPLSEFCDERREGAVKAIAAYFREVHDAKGNALDTKQREANVYCALMNHAVAKNWTTPGFPRPELPSQDIFAKIG